MTRTCFAVCLATFSVASYAQVPQEQPPAPAATDLKVELRSGTGSNRFQIGEVVPLDVMVSSSSSNRYLAPCVLFWEGCFGYPQCRYFNRWSIAVTPETGYKDRGKHMCMTMSGPTFEVPSHDLTATPDKFTYTLTNRFRFDTPGNIPSA
jgi:hypothetical protein